MKEPSCKNSPRPDHSKEVKRLNRAIGQLEGVKRMIEEQRYCPDILNQIKAVKSALHSISGSILRSHLTSCVSQAMLSDEDNERSEKIEELVELFKKM